MSRKRREPANNSAASRVRSSGSMLRERGVKSDKRAAFRNCVASIGTNGAFVAFAEHQIGQAGRFSRMWRIKSEKRITFPDCGALCGRKRAASQECGETNGKSGAVVRIAAHQMGEAARL